MKKVKEYFVFLILILIPLIILLIFLNFENIKNSLIQIPGSFWSVLAGSFFTLIGVYFTNRSNESRLRVQLQYEMKKSIFLDASEAFSVQVTMLSNFPNVEISQEKLTEEFFKKKSAISKVYLVANERTIEALMKFSAEFNRVFLSLSEKRFALLSQLGKMKIKLNQVEKHQRNQEEVTTFRRQDIVSKDERKYRHENLEELFKYADEQVTLLLGQYAELKKDLDLKIIDFNRECQQEIQKLNDYITPLLTAVREELDLPLNEEHYKRLVLEGDEKIKKATEDFLKNAENKTKATN